MIWMFGEVPIVTAAFFGFTFGSRIVDPLRDTSTRRAAMQGIGVAGFSYLVFILFFIVTITIPSNADPGFQVFVILAVIWVSFLTIGWLIELSGAIAGWLLCRYSCRAEVWELLVNAPRVTVARSYAMAAVAATILVISYVVGWILMMIDSPKY